MNVKIILKWDNMKCNTNITDTPSIYYIKGKENVTKSAKDSGIDIGAE